MTSNTLYNLCLCVCYVSLSIFADPSDEKQRPMIVVDDFIDSAFLFLFFVFGTLVQHRFEQYDDIEPIEIYFLATVLFATYDDHTFT